MKTITFDQACEHSATEFYQLRQMSPNIEAFDRACDWMRAQKFRADTTEGRTVSRNGTMAQFLAYDWGADYEARPSLVFHDFFRGFLLNKYSRIMRGIDD